MHLQLNVELCTSSAKRQCASQYNCLLLFMLLMLSQLRLSSCWGYRMPLLLGHATTLWGMPLLSGECLCHTKKSVLRTALRPSNKHSCTVDMTELLFAYLHSCCSQLVGQLVQHLQPASQLSMVPGINCHVPGICHWRFAIQQILSLLVSQLIP